MRKTLCVILTLSLLLCSACGNSTKKQSGESAGRHEGYFSEDELARLSDAITEVINDHLAPYALIVTVSVEEDLDYESSYIDARVIATIHANELSQKPIIYQAEIADYILNKIKKTDLVMKYLEPLDGILIEKTLFGANGEYSLTDEDGMVTLSEGDHVLVPGADWDTIRADYLYTPDGELSFEQWFAQKNAVHESLKVGGYYHLDLPFTNSEDLIVDKDFMAALYGYAQRSIATKNCNYFSISFADGYGIQFFGGDIYNSNYGTMSSIDHTLYSARGYLEIKHDTFRYKEFSD